MRIGNSLEDRLEALGRDGMADREGAAAGPPSAPKGALTGVVPVQGPGGRRLPLMRVLMSNACSFSCGYCPLRADRKVRRAALAPEEVGEEEAEEEGEREAVAAGGPEAGTEEPEEEVAREEVGDPSILRQHVRRTLGRYFFEVLRRKPIIVPVIVEV